MLSDVMERIYLRYQHNIAVARAPENLPQGRTPRFIGKVVLDVLHHKHRFSSRFVGSDCDNSRACIMQIEHASLWHHQQASERANWRSEQNPSAVTAWTKIRSAIQDHFIAQIEPQDMGCQGAHHEHENQDQQSSADCGHNILPRCAGWVFRRTVSSFRRPVGRSRGWCRVAAMEKRSPASGVRNLEPWEARGRRLTGLDVRQSRRTSATDGYVQVDI